MNRALSLLVAAALLTAAAPARAETRRVVLVAGNNTGYGSDLPLKYAERDAARVADVFRQLGRADHVEQLLGTNAEGVLAAFRRVERKVAGWKQKGDRVFFLFYYSGHGTERGLRMNGTELSTDALLASLSLLGADVRFAVIDACESGTFTREKGVTAKRQATVELLDRLETQGEVVMASTSRGEAAQESESLKGSFFTSYLLTGLRGAADRDGDGAVSINEAYGYAYDRTLVSTVITASGIQHPTFSTRLAGREDIKLTWPRAGGSHLRFRARTAGTFLLLSRDESTVLAEVPAARGSSARLALRPGTYVVKKRSPGGLYIALVQLSRGSDAELDESEMRKVPYAVLVEKGDAHTRGSITLSADLSAPVFGQSSGLALEAGYMRQLGPVDVWPTLSLSFGSGGSDGRSFDVWRASLAVVRRHQRPRWTTFVGLAATVPLFRQSLGDDERLSLGYGANATAGVFVRISDTTELLLQLAAGGELVRSVESQDAMPGWHLRWSDAADIGARVRF